MRMQAALLETSPGFKTERLVRRASPQNKMADESWLWLQRDTGS